METNFVKCDGCGGLHPENEVEIVVIKLRKGKNCNVASPTLPGLVPPKPIIPTVTTPAPINPNAPTINGKPMDFNAMVAMKAAEDSKLWSA